MAADGRAKFGDDSISSDSRTKLLTVGLWSIGCSGPVRGSNLLEESAEAVLSPPADLTLSRQAQWIAERLRAIAIDDGWIPRANCDAHPRMWDWQFLLGHPRGLWYIAGDMSITSQELVATGSGADYATGALEVLAETALPEVAVCRAVEVAIRHDTSCGGRILCHELLADADQARASVWGEEGRSRNPVKLRAV